MSKRLALFFVFALCISNLAALMLYSSPVKCVKWIEGHVTEDAIWTKEDTYRIINTAHIDPGVTLTIMPGTQVQFADNSSLIIKGSLDASGTDTEPIVLTSIRAVTDQPDPFPGAWNTTCFDGNESEHFTLRYATVMYAVHGLTIKGQGEVTIERNIFSNCSENGVMIDDNDKLVLRENTIEFNKNGIGTQHSLLLHFAAIRHSGILMENNLIRFNHENGIFLYSLSGPANQYPTYMYIEKLIISNNIVSDNGKNGIQLYLAGARYGILRNITISGNFVSQNGKNAVTLQSESWGGGDCIYNITISDNAITSNGNDGIILAASDARIRDIIVINNNISFNGGNGLYSYSIGRDIREIYDSTFHNNTVSFNDGDGIHLYSHSSKYKGFGWSYLRNVTISENKIIANGNIGLYASAQDYSPLPFDLLFLNNVISANSFGVYVEGGATVNLTVNSICYNDCGVLLLATKNNLARYNDICFNLMGMNVTNGATINAEENYWGDSKGPFHELLNFEGRGNLVNGELIDLDFIPFLTSNLSFINLPPFAVLSANSTSIGVGESIAFDASGSYDDFEIAFFFFNFSDGTDSGWVTKPIVEHEFTSAGTFNVTLIVMDMFGVRSIDSAIESIHVAGLVLPPDFPWTLIIASSILAVVVVGFVVYKVKAKRVHHRKTQTDTQRE